MHFVPENRKSEKDKKNILRKNKCQGDVMNFKEKYLAGELEFEAIDDYIEEWGNSDSELTLAKYLGLTEEEEAVWIDDSDEALMDMLDAQRKK